MLNILFVLVFGGLFVIYLKTRTKLPKNLPPGPHRLPIIGSLLQVITSTKSNAPFEVFRELNKKYGSILYLEVGATSQIHVDEYDIIKEILGDDIWIGRYYSEWMAQRSFGKILGVLMISGDVWKEMRRFTVRTLRDFGFGKQKSMEINLQEELQELKLRLELTSNENGNNVVAMRQFFTVSVLNVLWSMIAGFRFSHDDPKLSELLEIVENEVRSNTIGSMTSPIYLYSAFPWLSHILPYLISNRLKTKHEQARLHNFFREILHERRHDEFYKNDQNDYIEVFLREIDAHKHLPEGKNFYTDEQFIVVTMDLFMAGSETTSSTLEFAFLYLLYHPLVQRKVQNEIDTVIGPNRFPSCLDRPSMPYTEATILEIQRHANVLPISIRSNIRETSLRGYTIPTGTAAVINLHAMHMDEKLWGDPKNFRPERFLNMTGTQVINAEKILPFGTGKRVCLGEQLAKATIFTYLTTILQNFNFEVCPDYPLPPMDQPMLGFTLAPQPYYAIVTRRSHLIN